MRLINLSSDELKIEEVPSPGTRGSKPYAILSHTWREKESSYNDIVSGKATFASDDKILSFCKQVKEMGLEYCWVDTVCIDKSSSQELSEAINSMFDWYRRAKVCLIYLEDLDMDLEDAKSEVSEDAKSEASEDAKSGASEDAKSEASKDSKSERSGGWLLADLLSPRVPRHPENLFSQDSDGPDLQASKDPSSEGDNKPFPYQTVPPDSLWFKRNWTCQESKMKLTFKYEAAFRHSRWFERGWTLQELLAPKSVTFFDRNWNLVGTKLELKAIISNRTNIDEDVLERLDLMHFKSIARRMSWAAGRETTKIEDRAYSLLGIFGVNMPLVYGEGQKAFERLQLEIMKTSADQSIFAWGRIGAAPQGFLFPAQGKLDPELQSINSEDLGKTGKVTKDSSSRLPSPLFGSIFAPTPDSFANSASVVPGLGATFTPPYSMTNKGLSIQLRLIKDPWDSTMAIGILECNLADSAHHLLGIALKRTGGLDNVFERLPENYYGVATIDVNLRWAFDAEATNVYIGGTRSISYETTPTLSILTNSATHGYTLHSSWPEKSLLLYGPQSFGYHSVAVNPRNQNDVYFCWAGPFDKAFVVLVSGDSGWDEPTLRMAEKPHSQSTQQFWTRICSDESERQNMARSLPGSEQIRERLTNEGLSHVLVIVSWKQKDMHNKNVIKLDIEIRYYPEEGPLLPIMSVPIKSALESQPGETTGTQGLDASPSMEKLTQKDSRELFTRQETNSQDELEESKDLKGFSMTVEEIGVAPAVSPSIEASQALLLGADRPNKRLGSSGGSSIHETRGRSRSLSRSREFVRRVFGRSKDRSSERKEQSKEHE